MISGSRWAPAAVVCSVLLAGCDAAPPPTSASSPTATVVDDELLGAPERGLADTIDGILAQVRTIALEWQDEPVLAEMAFTLRDGDIEHAQLTFLAAYSERLLVIDGSDDGFDQQRTTLATVALQPMPGAAIAAVPALPAATQEPGELAAVVADACGVQASAVRYATGAPWAWNGDAWDTELAWTATAVADERLVAVDPVTGATDC